MSLLDETKDLFRCTPIQPGENIVVHIQGKTNPQKHVILGVHYDCTDGPGANDNATGIATALEAARLLKSGSFDYSIDIVFFTGEEIEDAGSKAFLGSLSKADKNNIEGVFIVDMIGNNQSPQEPHNADGSFAPEDLDIMADESNPGSVALEQATQTEIHQALSLPSTTSNNTDSSSDNDEFQAAGLPTVLFSEDRVAETRRDNPYFNTQADTVDKIDFNFFPQAARAVIIATADAAKPQGKRI